MLPPVVSKISKAVLVSASHVARIGSAFLTINAKVRACIVRPISGHQFKRGGQRRHGAHA